MRSALEWAQVRALTADGVSQREIARRFGISRNTVRRLVEADEPPRYQRAPAGSMLDPLEPVMRRLLEEWPELRAPRVTEILREDYGYVGSVDLVRRCLARLRPRPVRPAQRTGYRPGQVLQVDWGEMPTRPRIAGRERRVYTLVASLPYCAVARERCDSGAELSHRRGRLQSMADDVADGDSDPAPGQRERLVPVATDLEPFVARPVDRRGRHKRAVNQTLGKQRPLQTHGHGVLVAAGLVRARPLADRLVALTGLRREQQRCRGHRRNRRLHVQDPRLRRDIDLVHRLGASDTS